MKLGKLILALGLCATGFSASAQSFGVSATIAGACSVVVTPLAFGIYDPLAVTALDAQSTVQIACTTGAGSAISMGIGANISGAGMTATRRMRIGTTGSNYLGYTIYQPSTTTPGAGCAATTVWGNGTVGGASLASGAAPSAAARTYNVCGSIPAGQSSAIGAYADTVLVTVTL